MVEVRTWLRMPLNTEEGEGAEALAYGGGQPTVRSLEALEATIRLWRTNLVEWQREERLLRVSRCYGDGAVRIVA